MGLLMKSPASASIGGVLIDSLRKKKKPQPAAPTTVPGPRRPRRGASPAVGALMGGGAQNALR